MKDAKERGAKRFAAMFLAFVLLFSLANVLVNHRSVWDRLEQLDWDWAEAAQTIRQAESVLNEELLLHDPMIDAYGAVQAAMGKHEENAFDVVKDKNGFLYSGNFWNGFFEDMQQLAARTRRLELQVEGRGGRFGAVLFPMKHPEEGAGYEGIPYSDFSGAVEQFGGWSRYYGVPVLDLSDNWKENGLTQAEAFFRTDHHWTPLAAFYGYCALLDWMEAELGASIPDKERLCDLDTYRVQTFDRVMLGSQGRETGLIFAGGPEPYTVIRPREEGSYRLKVGKMDDFEVYEGGFSEALLRLDYQISAYGDYYHGEAERTYLYNGVSDYDSIQNLHAPSPKKILLLRDSYSTPIGAFLAQTFAQVDLLWVQQYTAGELEEFLAENRYDYVLLALYPTNLQEDFFPFGLSEEGA